MDDLHHLDLVELMLANHAACVSPGTAGLGSKARAVRGELDRQRVGGQHLLTNGIGQGDFGRRDEVLLVLHFVAATADPEHVLLELRQLPGALEDFAVDDVRRVALGVAVLLRLRVEHELRERAVQPRNRAAQKAKSRARQLRAGIEIEPERRAQIDMVFWREVEGTRRTPAAHLDVRCLVGSERHAVVRQVRHRHQHR